MSANGHWFLFSKSHSSMRLEPMGLRVGIHAKPDSGYTQVPPASALFFLLQRSADGGDQYESGTCVINAAGKGQGLWVQGSRLFTTPGASLQNLQPLTLCARLAMTSLVWAFQEHSLWAVL